MFTGYHFAWLAVCAVLILGAECCLHTKWPSLQTVLSFCCAGSVLSEFVKVFSVIKLVPSADGSVCYPYMELQHLPLHLCSIQILFIFYVRFARDSRLRTALLAFMYPSCLIGALCALLLPSIFTGSIDVSQAFTHPLAYQYFLYHAMLVILGLYICQSRQAAIHSRHYWSTLGFLCLLGFASLYLNSAFATAVYEDGRLVSVEYTTNFFFTSRPVAGLVITELWQWYLYLIALLLLAMALVALLYLPIFIRDAHQKRR